MDLFLTLRARPRGLKNSSFAVLSSCEPVAVLVEGREARGERCVRLLREEGPPAPLEGREVEAQVALEQVEGYFLAPPRFDFDLLSTTDFTSTFTFSLRARRLSCSLEEDREDSGRNWEISYGDRGSVLSSDVKNSRL